MLESISDQNCSTSNIENFTQVLGQRSKYLRYLNRCIKHSSSFSLSESASKTTIVLKNVYSIIEEQVEMKMPMKQHEKQQEEFWQEMQV